MIYAVAGWTGMRLGTLLPLNIISAVITTGLVAGLGFALGRQAVDAVLLVDRYAVLVSIAMVVVTAAIPLANRWIRRRATVKSDPCLGVKGWQVRILSARFMF